MDYIRGFFWGTPTPDSPPSPPQKKIKRKKKKRIKEERISLNGRDPPIDLLTKATFRIAHIKDAQYSINPDQRHLTVNLPKGRKRKDYVMPWYDSMDALMEDIEKEMQFDQFTSIDSVRLAAEYPNFFWNGMFHTIGQLSVLDAQLEKRGLLTKTRKRRK